MNNTFITHPSVRIKGTETNYVPVQCFEPLCKDKYPHMHCPFCMKSETYSDPVILKAHYRVKHVDKGIEFAGLKVLRCCDQCDIVGIIKGEKKFKGAHWHCYKCKNGFNRRDEAIKHYKTHFRNPLTTFQIQIAQDINQPSNQGFENEEATTGIQTQDFSVHQSLSESAYTHTVSLPSLHKGLDFVAMPGVGAVETVGDTQTIMIIQEDGSISSLQESPIVTQVVSSSDVSSMLAESQSDPAQDAEDTMESEQMNDIEDQLLQRIAELEKENKEQELEIVKLKKVIQSQTEKLATFKFLEQELHEQQHVPKFKTIQDLCVKLEVQHRELLKQQLAELKRAFAQSLVPQPNLIFLNSHTLNEDLGQVVISTAHSDDHSNSNAPITVALGFQKVRDQEVVENDSDLKLMSAIENPLDNSVKMEHVSEILQQNFDNAQNEDRLHIDDGITENDLPTSKRKREK